MNILYPLADSGTRWGNNELRYSLRSLDLVPGEHQIHIVTKILPKWLRNVRHVQCRDLGPTVAQNTARKILNGLKAIGSGEVIIMNDDFFFFRESTGVMGFDGLIQSRILKLEKSRKYRSYQKQMRDTLSFLIGKGIRQPMDFALHQPLFADVGKMIEVIEESKALARPISIINIYCNKFMDGQPSQNCKLGDLKDFAKQTQNRDSFSINEKIIGPEFERFMRERYPNKSRWET